MDIMGVGLGWQINSNFAIGLKWTGYWLSGGTFVPNSGTGIGIKISEKITFGIFNNINYETTFFYRYSDQKPEKSKVLIKGFAVDINIGDENINDNGFNFIWLVGVVVSSAQGSKPLLLPNLKIGFNINF